MRQIHLTLKLNRLCLKAFPLDVAGLLEVVLNMFICNIFEKKGSNLMKRITTTLILLMLVFAATSGFASSNGAPWPPDLSITKPEANVPAQLAPLSGKWIGSTGSGMGAQMAFEHIRISEFGLLQIQSVYAWNNRFVPAGWSRQSAKFTGKEIVFTITGENPLNGVSIWCNLPQNDSMSCSYSGPYSGSISLRREK